MSLKNIRMFSAAVMLFITTFAAQATVVEIRTTLGNIEVNLFDESTPYTVENFLSYVNSGAYANIVVHRSASDFIIQSEGYYYTGAALAGEMPIDVIETGPSVVNEPVWSNVRGTIAMAKLSGSADSATSQWFINLSNNSSNLDVQNSGFTVFGQVTDVGMQYVDSIAAIDTLNFGGALSDLPMQDYTAEDFNNDVVIQEEHLVIIEDIVVIDNTVNSAVSLSPIENTLINTPTNPGNDVSSGGGAMTWLGLLVLFNFGFRFLTKK